MATNRDQLLARLLRPLVEEWTFEEIEAALSLHRRSYDMGARADARDASAQSRAKAKLSAKELALKADIPIEQKNLIAAISERYDSKEFLPTIGDVKNFLEMRGRDTLGLKQRPEAFRRILNLLVDLPEDFLKKILDERLFSGPSDLGPLSDSINQVGEKIRSKRHI